ncbi:hypothetical protein TNCV_1035751 [Trichonephila clavipes]|nr:hypothetical protein TNCV_1035751 [Trichonephila clavipes]
MAPRYSCTRFVIDHIIEDVPVCDTASKVAVGMVSELRVHAARNVVELLMQIFVLQMNPILVSGHVTWLHDTLRNNTNKYQSLRGSLGKAGWSNRRISLHLHRIDMVVARCCQRKRLPSSNSTKNKNAHDDCEIIRSTTGSRTTSESVGHHLTPSRYAVISRKVIQREWW